MEIACKQAAIFTEHIMFHAVYADGLSLMFALVANVEHGFIAANLYVLHRQLPTLILSAEILQHVPAFLDWSSGRILHFEASRSDRLERGHEVIDPAFAEHVGLGPQKCRHLSVDRKSKRLNSST